MVEKIGIMDLRNEFERELEGYSDKTKELYLSWFNRFPHTHFINSNNENAQEIINQFLKKMHQDNSVSRAFLKLYLKCFGFNKLYDIPEKKKIRKTIKIKNTLTLQEIDILTEAMYKTGYEKGLAFRLIYEGGLRRSELKSIKYNSFLWDGWFNNWDKDIVLKIIGKGNKERFVLISGETIINHFSYLQEKHGLSDIQIKELILKAKEIDKRICKFKENWFYKHLTRVSKIVLNKNVNPHLLRHTRATHILDQGGEIKDIQNYLGHANISTTEIYLHRDIKQSIRNISQLKN